MNNKRLAALCALSAAALLLSACASPSPSTLPRVSVPPAAQEGVCPPENALEVNYAPLPEKSTRELWVNGENIETVYQKDGRLFVRADDLARALKASISNAGDPRQSVTLRFSHGLSLSFSTLDSGETLCLLTREGFLLPCSALSAAGYHVYEAGGALFYTAYPTGDDLPKGVTVPTLMYHAVSDEVWGIRSLFVSPSAMEEQLQYLLAEGYTPIFFEDLARADEIEKPVLLTFDDGYDDNYLHLFPLLKKYKVKANIFLITGSLGKENTLTEEQVIEMSASGLVSFQSHTVTHPYLDEVSEEGLHWQLRESKAAIARLTGREPFVLCYPSGRYNALTLKVTREYYSFALLMQDGKLYSTDDDPYHVMRQYVQRSTTIEQFEALLQA